MLFTASKINDGFLDWVLKRLKGIQVAFNLNFCLFDTR